MTTTEPKLDQGTELAKQRNREAADNTLMSWIRTSLAFIGFGFGIDVITKDPNLATAARILGLSFISVGVFAGIVAMAQFCRELNRLKGGIYRYEVSFPLGLAVVAALCLVGLFAGISIVIQALAG